MGPAGQPGDVSVIFTRTSPPSTSTSYTRPRSITFMSSSGSFTCRKASRTVAAFSMAVHLPSKPKLVDRVAPHQTAAPARDPRVQPARHGPHAGEAKAAGEPALPRQEPQDLGSGIGAREHAAVGEHEVHRRRERGERNTERRHPRLVLERDHADPLFPVPPAHQDRKSTRLNSSHLVISYAVFCLKKKKK